MPDSGTPDGLEIGPAQGAGADAAATRLLIPGGDALLGAQFQQIGDDLILDGQGLHVTLPGYFNAENLPTLVTDTGVHLDGDLVRTLTPPEFASDTCQAAPESAIGKIGSVVGSVTVQHADGSTAALAAGDPVFQGDVLQAGADGKLDLVFVDGTSFSLGAGARMTLDDLVFDPNNSQNNSFSATVLQGAFVFATGQIAPSGNMDVKTPVGTIGIRGTTVAGLVQMEGSESVFTLVPDPKTGHVGKVIFSNAGGTQVLDVANATTKVVSFFISPTQPVVLPAADLIQFFDLLLQQFYDSHGGTPSNFENGGEDGRQGSNQTEPQTAEEALAQLGIDDFTTAAGPDDGTTVTVGTGTVGFAALSPLLGYVPPAPVGFTFTTVTAQGGIGTSNLYGANQTNPSGGSQFSQDSQQTTPQQQPGQTYTVVSGGTGDDTLTGPINSPLQIDGNDGNDSLTGGDQGDILNGGDGDDNLDAGPGNDQINGQGGNDTIVGGHGEGDDKIDGGDGIDTVRYVSATQTIIVDLSAGTAYGDPAIGVDTLTNIENVVGGSGNDVIIGNDAANNLQGGPGDDQLAGQGGDDVLVGDGGTDTAIFSGKLSDYLIQETGEGTYTVTDYRAGGDGVDTLTDIEVVRFADGQSLIGDVVNKAPAAATDANTATNTVAENAAVGTTVGLTALALDGNAGDKVSYSLSDDAGGLFQIDAATGVVTVAASLDYETATSHQITVVATDKGGLTASQNFTIAVTNVDDNPTSTPVDADDTPNSLAENTEAGAAVGITANATDGDAGATVTYSLSDDAEGLFQIDANTGVVSLKAALDYETATSHQITVVATSSDGSPATSQTFTITVTNVDDNPTSTPTDADPVANTVAENAAIGTTVGITALATDSDAGATVAYSLSDDAEGLFQIDASTGVVTVKAALDYETATSHQITVVATSSDGSSETSQTFTIDVGNVNDNAVTTPTDTDGDANIVAEDAEIGSTVGIQAKATDADDDAVTFSLSDDAGGLFAIDENTGVVTVAGKLDYESATSHQITVLASSSDGSSSTQTFTIAVTNVNDNPTTAPTDANAAANTVAENAAIGTAVGITALATDGDTGASVSYSLSDDAGGLFQIDANTGVLTVKAALDYETADSHQITVVATSSDGSPAASQSFIIAVTNVGDNPTTTPTDSNPAANSVAENAAIGTAVGITALAADGDAGATLSYSLSNDAGGLFQIDANTGVVTVKAALDYETATSHQITVVATSSDGSPAASQTFTIAVSNVNDNPTTTPTDANPATNTVAENAAIGTAVGITALATDGDAGATISYSLSNDAGGLFQIDGTTGVVTVKSALDYETATSHQITVVATSSDGSPATSQTFTIAATNVNDNPTTTPTDANAATNTVAENAAVGTAVGMTALATDGDTGTTVSYSLSDDAGGLFQIDANTGVVTVKAALDYETATSHQITVVATSSDGSPAASETFTIAVSDVNEAPEIVSSATFYVTENNKTVATLEAADPDAGTTLSYGIVGGADKGLFSIDAETGALSFIAAPDFEAPADSGGDNVYEVEVEVSDGSLKSSQIVAVNVQNQNEPPSQAVDTDPWPNQVTETPPPDGFVYLAGVTAHVTDPDAGATITYTLKDDFGGRFGVDVHDGRVFTFGGLDYETQSSYDLVVIATDNTLLRTETHFTVNVLDANEAPTITSDGGADVVNLAIDENTPFVTQVQASDPDAGNVPTFSIIGGADKDAFDIDPETGDLTFKTGPDYDAPTDSDKDNVYEVQVQASDGTLTDIQTINVTVNDLNETAAPVMAHGSVSIAQDARRNQVNTTDLQFTDSDTDPSEIVYTLRVLPSYGVLTIAGVIAAVGTTFTQADIDDGKVFYETSGATPEGFIVDVTDGTNTLVGQSVSVGVTTAGLQSEGQVDYDLDGAVQIGNSAYGQLDIVNVSGITLFGAQIGVGPDGDGDLVVSGEDADLTLGAGGIEVGETDSVLRVMSGATVTSAGGASGLLVDGGTVWVGGAGSTLAVTGTDSTIRVGGSGAVVPDMQVFNGGLVGALKIVIGGGGEAAGSITVDDAKLVASNDYGLFSGDQSGKAGAVNVGVGGLGTLNIISGGSLEIRPASSGDIEHTGTEGAILQVGLGGGIGHVTVEDKGSTVAVSGPGATVQIGVDASGYLTVTGGSLDVTGDDNLFGVGQQASGTGNVTVDQGGSITALDAVIGQSGMGIVTLTNSATMLISNDSGSVSDDPLTEGDEGEYAGFVTVGEGNGSLGILNVLGGALLTIRDGGAAELGGPTNYNGAGMTIGAGLGSTGQVMVTGDADADLTSEILISETGSSTWPSLTVGNLGQGSLTIGSRGLVSLEGNNAQVVVSSLTAEGFASVQSSITVQNGGNLKLHGTDTYFAIGSWYDADGLVTVDGSGSLIQLAQDAAVSYYSGPHLDVGYAGSGHLVLSNGGQFEISGAGAYVGIGQGGGNGTIDVQSGSLLKLEIDSGDSLTYGATFLVGGSTSGGGGTLNITGGGGVEISSPGQTIFGIGLTYSDSYLVAGYGQASVTLDDHAHLTLTQNGPSEMPYALVLDVYGQSGASLDILNASTVTLDGRALISVGTGTETNGSIDIEGGSSLTASKSGSLMEIGSSFGGGDVTVGAGSSLSIGVAGNMLTDNGATFSDFLADIKVTGDSVLDIAGGTVNGDVLVNGGTLRAAEAAVATAEINGDLHVSGGDARIEIGVVDFGDGQHDLFDVKGDVQVTDGTIVFDFNDATWNFTSGDSFKFLTATGTLDFATSDVSSVAYGVGQDFRFALNADSSAASFEVTEYGSGGNGAVYQGGSSGTTFFGTEYADALFGGGGNDNLYGGGAASGDHDILDGGAGADFLTGTSGSADFFQNTTSADNFHAVVNGTVSSVTAGQSIDQISNFEVGIDKITFEGGYFTPHVVPAFNEGINFSTLADGVEYDGTNAGTNTAYAAKDDALILDGNGNLIYDDNGSDDGYTIVAHVDTTGGKLTASDIQVNNGTF